MPCLDATARLISWRRRRRPFAIPHSIRLKVRVNEPCSSTASRRLLPDAFESRTLVVYGASKLGPTVSGYPRVNQLLGGCRWSEWGRSAPFSDPLMARRWDGQVQGGSA